MSARNIKVRITRSTVANGTPAPAGATVAVSAAEALVLVEVGAGVLVDRRDMPALQAARRAEVAKLERVPRVTRAEFATPWRPMLLR